MTHPLSELPSGCIIRPLQLTDIDLLSLNMMPNNPRRLPSWVSVKMALILSKVGQGIVLAIIPGGLFYVLILFFIGFHSYIPWLWIGIGYFSILSVCLRFVLTHRSDWLKFCWIVEQKGCFIVYAILRPYKNYSIFEAIQVHPKWGRKGIGSTLVRTLIQNSQKPIYIESAFHITGFYTYLGFRKIRLKNMPSDVQERFSFRGATVLMVYD
ncbi:GNAT family N-acetyltransferase [Anabaena sp. WFMT]|uniref:GNAT family N-acetyltransferase n=1 Tax=Anabaena sp. WFMT TaxID=3449730 RepID=UPI003F27A02A